MSTGLRRALGSFWNGRLVGRDQGWRVKLRWRALLAMAYGGTDACARDGSVALGCSRGVCGARGVVAEQRWQEGQGGGRAVCVVDHGVARRASRAWARKVSTQAALCGGAVSSCDRKSVV